MGEREALTHARNRYRRTIREDQASGAEIAAWVLAVIAIAFLLWSVSPASSEHIAAAESAQGES